MKLNKLHPVLSIIFASFCAAIIFVILSQLSEAKTRIRGNCVKDYQSWKKKGAWRAFAVAKNGRACGFTWEYGSRKKAISAALIQCRKRGRGCRIYSVTGAQSVNIRLSGVCKRSHKRWKERKRYKAFVISSNGSACHYNWNHNSIDLAVAGAKDSCLGSVGCRVYDVGASESVVKRWQEQLQTLELYSGDIDADWGSGSKSAMRKFADIAELKDVNNSAAFRQLSWAAQIKSQFNMSAELAIQESKQALRDSSLQFLREKTETSKTVEQTPSEPTPPSQITEGTAWKFVEIKAYGENTSQVSRCTLSNGDIEFKHFGTAFPGTITTYSKLDKIGGNVSASTPRSIQWAIDDEVPRKVAIRHHDFFGDFIKIRDPFELVQKLSSGEKLHLWANNGGRDVIRLRNASTPVLKFLVCMHKVLAAESQSNKTSKLEEISAPVAPKSAPAEQIHSTKILKMGDGSTYLGATENGKPHGYGTMKLSDGSIYSGLFERGLLDGTAVVETAEGDRFEGNFKKGQRHGEGVLHTAEGETYKGTWRFGKEYKVNRVE